MFILDFLQEVAPYQPGDILFHGPEMVAVISLGRVAQGPVVEGQRSDRLPGIYWDPDTLVVITGGIRYTCKVSSLQRKPPGASDEHLLAFCVSDETWAKRDAAWAAFQEDLTAKAQARHMRVCDLPETPFREGDWVNCRDREGECLVERVDYVQIKEGKALPRLESPDEPLVPPYRCVGEGGQVSLDADQLTLVRRGPNW